MSTGGVQSVDRAIDLLDALAAGGGELSISELASATGLPLPTIHRLLRALGERSFVLQRATRRYALGPRLVPLGEAAALMAGAGARRALERAVERVGESANLATRDGDRVVYIAQAASAHSMRMFTEVGRRVHAHSTGVGKALLSQLADDEVRALVARTGMPPMTDRTITDVDALLAEIARIRRRGYAVDDEEQESGVRCVAVPVTLDGGRFAMSVSGPVHRMTERAIEEAAPMLLELAQELGGPHSSSAIDAAARAAPSVSTSR
jgi:IclR family transcriptional regulator, acetate operon repressor